MPETPAIDAEDAAVDTVGQKYVNIDRPKTSDSNWIFQRRFRDSSVRQYENAGAFVMESAARVAVLERLVEGPAGTTVMIPVGFLDARTPRRGTGRPKRDRRRAFRRCR